MSELCESVWGGCLFLLPYFLPSFFSFCSVLVWRDVRGREEPPPVAQLPRPPVLVGPVCDGEDIAPPEFELALLLKERRHFWLALEPQILDSRAEG